MPHDKRALTRTVRARMAATGENYTQALKAILAQRHDDDIAPPGGQPTFGGHGRKHRTVRALELLAESYEAHLRGDTAAFDAGLRRAYAECGIDTVTAIHGGMLIGEIPRPSDPGWTAWLDDQRASLDHDPAADLSRTAPAGTLPMAEVERLLGPHVGPAAMPWAREWNQQGICVTPSRHALEVRTAGGELVGLIAAHPDGTPTTPLEYRAIIRADTSPPVGVRMPYGYLPPRPKQAADHERRRWLPHDPTDLPSIDGHRPGKDNDTP